MTPLDAASARPAGFDPLAATQRAPVSIPSTWRVEVWLGATLEEIRHRTSLPCAFFAAVDDGVPLVIRQPPELRDALHRHAHALARDARRTDDSDASWQG